MNKDQHAAVQSEIVKLRNTVADMEARIQKGDLSDDEINGHISSLQRINADFDPKARQAKEKEAKRQADAEAEKARVVAEEKKKAESQKQEKEVL